MSETNAVDPIVAAMAAAAIQAQTALATQAQAVATPTTNAVAVMPQRGPALTMDDMTGGITVDSWLKVKEFGFLIGKESKLYSKPIEVSIDMSACQPSFAVKFGNPAKYFKTYDRVMEASGGTWADAVARAQRAQPDVREYRSVDIPMTVLSETDGLLEVGSTLGYSTPTTGWAEWEKFYRSCATRALTTSTVTAVLNFVAKKNTKNNVWGIVTFTLKD